MYSIILAIHNIMRWVVVILIVIAAVRAYMGWFNKRDWTEADRKAGSFAAMAMDIQILLGLALYFFLSPLIRSAFQDFRAAMKLVDLRFFAIEHVLFMFLAVVFTHLGSVLPRKAEESGDKHKRAALAFSLALLMIVIGMPWMRPLLPGLH